MRVHVSMQLSGVLVRGSASGPSFVYDTETFSRTLGVTWDIDTRNGAEVYQAALPCQKLAGI